MVWLPVKGQQVIAGSFGSAIVRKVFQNEALVSLDGSGIEVMVPHNDLVPAGSELDGRAENQVSASNSIRIIGDRSGGPPDRLRRAIEALRFGLVPEDEIESLTLHYEELQAWVLNRLPDTYGDSPQVSEICGPFGSGKSHTMAAMRYIARQRGYMTARVEVDGSSVTLSDPEKLLYSLWSSLSANEFDSVTPILELCLRAIKKSHSAPNIAPAGIDRVSDNYKTARLIRRQDLFDLCGHALDSIMVSSNEFTATQVASMISSATGTYLYDIRVRRMIGLRVAERPFDFIETWVGYAVLSRLAGNKGLVISIDEFELERFLTATKLERVAELLRVLASYLNRELHHPKAPLAVFFATIGEEGHLGDKFVDRLINRTPGDYFPLKGWSRQERAELSRRIFDLYSKAYGLADSYSHSVADTVEAELAERGDGDGGMVRAFIKSYVGALDSLYGPRQRQ